MKPRFKIEKRGKDWCVTGRAGRTIYSDTCYPKAIGVLDFLTEWGGWRAVKKVEAAEHKGSE